MSFWQNASQTGAIAICHKNDGLLKVFKEGVGSLFVIFQKNRENYKNKLILFVFLNMSLFADLHGKKRRVLFFGHLSLI